MALEFPSRPAWSLASQLEHTGFNNRGLNDSDLTTSFTMFGPAMFSSHYLDTSGHRPRGGFFVARVEWAAWSQPLTISLRVMLLLIVLVSIVLAFVRVWQAAIGCAYRG